MIFSMIIVDNIVSDTMIYHKNYHTIGIYTIDVCHTIDHFQVKLWSTVINLFKLLSLIDELFQAIELNELVDSYIKRCTPSTVEKQM